MFRITYLGSRVSMAVASGSVDLHLWDQFQQIAKNSGEGSRGDSFTVRDIIRNLNIPLERLAKKETKPGFRSTVALPFIQKFRSCLFVHLTKSIPAKKAKIKTDICQRCNSKDELLFPHGLQYFEEDQDHPCHGERWLLCSGCSKELTPVMVRDIEKR